MSSKRHSILPTIDRSGPKPPVNFSSSLVISDNALLSGTHSITLQAETLVHPRSRIESSEGSILVGRRCIIQERAHLGAKAQDMATARSGGVSLGDYVMVEAGSVVECGGTEIGEGTILQIGSRICSGAKIGKNCTITPLAVIPAGTELPDFTIVFSNGSRRIDKRPATELRKVAIVKQIATLKHVIPSNPDKFK